MTVPFFAIDFLSFENEYPDLIFVAIISSMPEQVQNNLNI
jgi:hypothetical protein